MNTVHMRRLEALESLSPDEDVFPIEHFEEWEHEMLFHLARKFRHGEDFDFEEATPNELKLMQYLVGRMVNPAKPVNPALRFKLTEKLR